MKNMFIRHALRGNFNPVKFWLRSAWYGMTHPRCQCGRHQWPRLRRYCRACRAVNVIKAIFG